MAGNLPNITRGVSPVVYQWKEGSRIPVKAQVAGEQIARLTERNGGHLAPSDVVDDARPEGSPLHPAFEWDNGVAGEKFREEQARQMIRSIRVVHEHAGQEQSVLGYVHVELAETGPAYVTTARAVSEADLQEQMIADALKSLEAWRHRHQHIVALGPLLRAVANAIREMEQQAKRKKRRRPARAEAVAGAI
jgi:hypothetical protein